MRAYLQERAADRRGIPYVWFPGRVGGSDEVRDIRSGVQVAADADTWRPDDDDLRPRVVDTLGPQTPSAELH